MRQRRYLIDPRTQAERRRCAAIAARNRAWQELSRSFNLPARYLTAAGQYVERRS